MQQQTYLPSDSLVGREKGEKILLGMKYKVETILDIDFESYICRVLTVSTHYLLSSESFIVEYSPGREGGLHATLKGGKEKESVLCRGFTFVNHFYG
ncbi:hypothetical protein DMENIID0001_007780 [Sergentomyia squamirostris]